MYSYVPESALFTVKPRPKSRTMRRNGAPRARKAATHGLGRPRDERIDAEVTFAVLSALKEGGYRAVTIDGIAQRVGRARTSIYRRWSSKRSLVAYAVVSEMGDDPAADTGSVRGDLEAAVSTLLNAFAGPLGRAQQPWKRSAQDAGASRGGTVGRRAADGDGGHRDRRRANSWLWR